jgi:hypothetical protein
VSSEGVNNAPVVFYNNNNSRNLSRERDINPQKLSPKSEIRGAQGLNL